MKINFSVGKGSLSCITRHLHEAYNYFHVSCLIMMVELLNVHVLSHIYLPVAFKQNNFLMTTTERRITKWQALQGKLLHYDDPSKIEWNFHVCAKAMTMTTKTRRVERAAIFFWLPKWFGSHTCAAVGVII